MKRISFQSILIIGFFPLINYSCGIMKKHTKINCNTVDSTELRLNREFVDLCIDYIEKREIIFPIFGIKSFDAKEIMDTIPMLRDYRNKFEEQDDILGKVLEKDSEYVELRKKMAEFKKVYDKFPKTSIEYNEGLQKIYDKLSKTSIEYKKELQKVYDRLSETSIEYKEARINRDKALYMSNIITLKYIYNLYKEKNLIFPTDFIYDNLKSQIKTKKIATLEKECNTIREKCKHKND